MMIKNGRTVAAWCMIVAFVAAALGVALAFNGLQDESSLDVGDKAPEFAYTDVNGERISLSELGGDAVLLLFLDLQTGFSMDESVKSRAQVTFAKSMLKQYSSVGLNVVIVDSGKAPAGRRKENEKLRNLSSDLMLEGISLLADDTHSALANAFRVDELPTSFLIDKAGIIKQRWNDFALTSQFALAIEIILGPPAYRKDYASGEKSSNELSDTAAMAVFPGFPPARPFPMVYGLSMEEKRGKQEENIR